MRVRARGFVTRLASLAGWAVLYWLFFRVLGGSRGTVRVAAYPLALPLIGMVAGTIELTTGLPFTQVAASWERLPRWLQVPLGCLIGLLLVVGIFYAFYFVLTRF